MSNIAVFGGTTEGRLIAETLRNTKINIHICVATEYGGTLLPTCDNIHIHCGRMNSDEMEDFFTENEVDCCFDATHPYAVEVTENIYNACKNIGLQYMRVMRDECSAEGENVVYMDSIEDAVNFLNTVDGKILITTGSKDLEKYTAVEDYKNRCFARVLPTPEVIDKCATLGFEGKNVIAMQGPFSEELNRCMLKQTGAKWLVTKNSGSVGGFEQKCDAAVNSGANVVVIGRAKEKTEDTRTVDEAIDFIKKRYGIDDKRRIYLVGVGVGNKKLLTKEAEDCLKNCDVIVGARRIVDMVRGSKPYYISYVKDEIKTFIDVHTQFKNIALVYSGDIGFYSGASGMKKLLGGYDVFDVPGISSPIYFLDKLGIGWDSVKLVSCHGQDINIIPMIRENSRVCALLGKTSDVSDICKELEDFEMNDIKVTVGERLSYDDENIYSGHPSDFVDRQNDKLAVVLFENKTAENKIGFGISDDEFVRGNVPMTKEEIRVVALSKLKLKKNSILYDIGAGTGSVSIEAALQCDDGFVYAVERKLSALNLIRKNRKKFKAHNVKVVEGEAPICLWDLPKPTHAFIGGSNGKMLEIIRAVHARNKYTRFVINAVTIETLSQLEEVKKEFPQYDDMEIIQLNVAKNRQLGRYNLMTAENPVYVISFGGKKYNDSKRR